MFFVWKLLIIISIFIAAMMRPAYADTQTEKENLARIVQVLNSLTPLIDAAEREKDTQLRVQFHYEWLRSDILQIKQGIQERLKETPIEPRIITPIKGDYIEYRNKIL